MPSEENDATPLAVVAVVVPDSVPPPAFVPIAIVTATSLLAMRFPAASMTSTATGAPVGVYACDVIVWAMRAFAGWAVETNRTAQPPVTTVVSLLCVRSMFRSLPGGPL